MDELPTLVDAWDPIDPFDDVASISSSGSAAVSPRAAASMEVFPVVSDDMDAIFNRLFEPKLGATPKPKARPPTKLEIVADAWRRMSTMRVGDRLDPSFVNSEMQLSLLPQQHKSTWDLHGMAREAWCGVGGRARRRGGLSHTSR